MQKGWFCHTDIFHDSALPVATITFHLFVYVAKCMGHSGGRAIDAHLFDGTRLKGDIWINMVISTCGSVWLLSGPVTNVRPSCQDRTPFQELRGTCV